MYDSFLLVSRTHNFLDNSKVKQWSIDPYLNPIFKLIHLLRKNLFGEFKYFFLFHLVPDRPNNGGQNFPFHMYRRKWTVGVKLFPGGSTCPKRGCRGADDGLKPWSFLGQKRKEKPKIPTLHGIATSVLVLCSVIVVGVVFNEQLRLRLGQGPKDKKPYTPYLEDIPGSAPPENSSFDLSK